MSTMCFVHVTFSISRLHLHNALLFRFSPGRMADWLTGPSQPPVIVMEMGVGMGMWMAMGDKLSR